MRESEMVDFGESEEIKISGIVDKANTFPLIFNIFFLLKF